MGGIKTRLIPYIKSTRNKHSSGYNRFECGYIDAGQGYNLTHKYVVSRSADNVCINFSLPPVHMDSIGGGYIRIWSNGVDIKWLAELDHISDMELVSGVPDVLTEPEPIEQEFGG